MTGKGKGLQNKGEISLNEERQEDTNLNSRKSLINRLKRGKETREKFVSSHVDKGTAFQIRAMRDRQEISQMELAGMIGTNQNNISRLESSNYGKATLTTLKKLASAFDVGLVVRFVPFSQLINWVSGTPFWDRGLSTHALGVSSFEEEENTISDATLVEISAPAAVSLHADLASDNVLLGSDPKANSITLNITTILDRTVSEIEPTYQWEPTAVNE